MGLRKYFLLTVESWLRYSGRGQRPGFASESLDAERVWVSFLGSRPTTWFCP